MRSQEMLHSHVWQPFSYLGFTGNFWTIQADTIISTWIILGIITIASILINQCLKKEQSLVRWATLQYVQIFRDLYLQSIKSCSIGHLAMAASLFTFILLCNTIQIIPWLEEPTKDLNTTVALGLISFFFVHSNAIYAKGLKKYISHYFEPFIIMLPLHIISAFSSIISLSFRLFGNIFGGFIISSLYTNLLKGSITAQTIGLLTGANIVMLLLFGILEGIIQAFIFTMLTMTYLSMEIIPEEHDSSSHSST